MPDPMMTMSGLVFVLIIGLSRASDVNGDPLPAAAGFDGGKARRE
jgi:hypothetical protein